MNKDQKILPELTLDEARLLCLAIHGRGCLNDEAHAEKGQEIWEVVESLLQEKLQ